MNRDKEKKVEKVAFALGGLAGNNAHGAGFLHAAMEYDITPEAISCTSGQILWVYRYLSGLKGDMSMDLREILRDEIREVNPMDNRDLACLSLFMFGKPGVFVPAWSGVLCDWIENSQDLIRKMSTEPGKSFMIKECAELAPCRFLAPDFPPTFFEDIASTFCKASVGIIFNSYNPRTGEEYVYLNEKARGQLHQRPDREKDRYAPGTDSGYRDRTKYRDIDAEAVRDALWLYDYGFDQKESEFVDGAYFRGIILSELTMADKIFCVRPINHRWQGHMPRNRPELNDLKTEIGFDGAYCGERYRIRMINKLLSDDKLKECLGKKYHEIHLVEMEIKQPRGFFDYIFESEAVFNDAYEDAVDQFKKEKYQRKKK